MDEPTLRFLIVLGFLSLPVYWLAEALNAWVQRGRVSIIDQVEVDHVVCEGDDCEQVLCYCGDVGQPCCPGTVEPGCSHVGEFVCEYHRLEKCVECRIDYSDDRAADLAEDMWRGLA